MVLALATLVGWWMQIPDPPWISFNKSSATYTPHDNQLSVSDEFTVNRECEGAAWHYIVVLWDHTVRALSPIVMPDMSQGHHVVNNTMTWSADNDTPHGATIRAIGMCSDDSLAVSDGAPIRIADERLLPMKLEEMVPPAGVVQPFRRKPAKRA